MRHFMVVLLFIISGCVGIPDGIKPVSNFDINRYLGKWYEIARLDHAFERDLQQVTARYRLREDGAIQVINRGFKIASNTWREVQGKALFVDDPEKGYLKVSFFGPFYAAYIIFELDPNYQYAFVTSSDKSYLWLLSRGPAIDESLRQYFLQRVAELGFDKNKLLFVEQSPKKMRFSESVIDE